MNKVLVDRELLERIVNTNMADYAVIAYQHKEIRAILAQPAEVGALMKWKQTAEYWYGQYRFVKHGQSPAEYPTEGKLDEWHNSYHNT